MKVFRYFWCVKTNFGPLIFLVYINDLARSSLILKFNLHAADTSVCLSGNSLNTLIENLIGELSKVSIWFRANRLTLNSSKSHFIIFIADNVYFL